VAAEDRRPEELPVEGWEEFRVTDRQNQAPRAVLDRLLGRAS
jgi:hypothetical protein